VRTQKSRNATNIQQPAGIAALW